MSKLIHLLDKEFSYTPCINYLVARDRDSLLRQLVNYNYNLIVSSFILKKFLKVNIEVLY